MHWEHNLVEINDIQKSETYKKNTFYLKITPVTTTLNIQIK